MGQSDGERQWGARWKYNNLEWRLGEKSWRRKKLREEGICGSRIKFKEGLWFKLFLHPSVISHLNVISPIWPICRPVARTLLRIFHPFALFRRGPRSLCHFFPSLPSLLSRRWMTSCSAQPLGLIVSSPPNEPPRTCARTLGHTQRGRDTHLRTHERPCDTSAPH